MNTHNTIYRAPSHSTRSKLLALAALVGSSGWCTLAAAPAGGSVQVVIGADRDNTIYATPFIEFSNGQGIHVFTGASGSGQARRTLLRFDVAAALPAGATVISAELQMHVSKASTNTPRSTSLHRALVDWGEGASDADGEEGTGAFAEPGDASWNFSFYPNTSWSQPGGDFTPAASATRDLSTTGTVSWASTPALVGDVQLWSDTPAANFGWIIIGDESAAKTAKRLDSRQNQNEGFRPLLRIVYQPAPPCALQVAASEVVRTGTPANPAALLPGATSAPVLGSVWDPRIDHTTFLPTALVDVFVLGGSATNTPSGLGTILAFPPLVTFTGAPGVPFTIPIPADCNLAGITLSWQGASADANTIALTNALDVVLGTF